MSSSPFAKFGSRSVPSSKEQLNERSGTCQPPWPEWAR